MNNYQPSANIKKILLFMSENTVAQMGGNEFIKNSAFGWQEFSRETVKIYSVPGDHYSMLQPPNLHVITEQINGILK